MAAAKTREILSIATILSFQIEPSWTVISNAKCRGVRLHEEIGCNACGGAPTAGSGSASTYMPNDETLASPSVRVRNATKIITTVLFDCLFPLRDDARGIFRFFVRPAASNGPALA